jgi:hypothetical protein
MANINDMGLPQGLPELPGGVMSGLNRFNQYNPSPALAQDYANRFASQNNNRSREMTAADLGLPDFAGDVNAAARRLMAKIQEHIFGRSDAPYSFWLGAAA